jgi:CCR4-NOT transcription complex subunit 3
LKREIKKLQRLRDQIKTWMGSNDIKDKKVLTEQRKLIEQEMERFKACEKEMKTKAYSKEGLTNSGKLDPREREKLETSTFIQSMLEELERQVEALEAEQETLQATMKKGKKDNQKADRISEIENSLERHKWHVSKMEIILRMIENGTLAPDAVNALQEDIKYYVESNQDADFAEDEAIYDELNLEEELEMEPVEMGAKDEGNSLEDLAMELSKDIEESKKAPPATIATITAPAAVPGISAKKAMSPVASKASPVGGREMKYASAASSIPQGLSPLPPPPKVAGPPLPPPAPEPVPAKVPATPTAPWAENVKLAKEEQKSPSVAGSTTTSPRPSTPPEPSSSATTATSVNFPSFPLPPGLQDLVHAFDAARKRIGSPAPIGTIAKLLETSFLNCPDSSIADRPRAYHPEAPYPTPPYYPQDPLNNLDDPSIMAKMELDTLFYIFYYRQGSYQQHLAARELKNRSWRFHKLFLTWFQRHEEPKVISSEYEQGTYRFFDFEGSWMQRRKTNFKFEYQYLEDEL